jgi:methylated-DNA-[protein]-cysteine S-methyltransferase
MTHATQHPTPLGMVLITSDGINLTGLWFVGQEHCPDVPCDGIGEGRESNGPPVGVKVVDIMEQATRKLFASVRDWLDAYFAGKNPDPGAIPITFDGSAFQVTVWNALRDIRYGSVETYGELAARVGCTSARAVGGAVGRNPVSIIVPCHRVVGAGGRLTGYGGGLERKLRLLELEGAI